MYMSPKFRHLHFLHERRQNIMKARSVSEIFDILDTEKYWNYTDFTLLLHIVQKFGNRKLRRQMKRYVAALEQFEKGTTIIDIVNAKLESRDVPQHYRTAVLRLGKDPSKCTLYDVREFVESLSKQSSLNPYVLLVNEVTTSSVVITLAFPRNALELIPLALDTEFLKSQLIISAIIDNKLLEKYDEEYMKGLQLLRASRQGDEDTITLLLRSGVSTGFTHANGVSALHLASAQGQKGVVAILLDHGANIHAVNKEHWSALHEASVGGHYETVQLLLEKGAEPNRLNLVPGANALHVASVEGHTAVVRLLLDHGADIHAKDMNQWSALHQATMSGHFDTVQLLLEKGAEPNDINAVRGETALHLASSEGLTDVVGLLLVYGADIHAVDVNQWTPLHEASRNGQYETMHLLLERGANPNILDVEGRTAAMLASERGYGLAVELLIQGGADLSIQDEGGLTALLWATLRGHPEAVSMLVQCGADLNTQNKEGLTALMMAVKEGQTAIVNTLLEGGADPNIRENSTGWTALFFAAQKGHLEIVRKLVGAGANVLVKDKNEVTALDVARVHGREDVCEALGAVPQEETTLPFNQQSTSPSSLVPIQPTPSESNPRTHTFQTLKRMVNRSVQRITDAYQELERRLKSATTKELLQQQMAKNQDEREATRESVHVTSH